MLRPTPERHWGNPIKTENTSEQSDRVLARMMRVLDHKYGTKATGLLRTEPHTVLLPQNPDAVVEGVILFGIQPENISNLNSHFDYVHGKTFVNWSQSNGNRVSLGITEEFNDRINFVNFEDGRLRYPLRFDAGICETDSRGNQIGNTNSTQLMQSPFLLVPTYDTLGQTHARLQQVSIAHFSSDQLFSRFADSFQGKFGNFPGATFAFIHEVVPVVS